MDQLPVAISWSGGKDAAYALFQLGTAKVRPACLFTILQQENRRVTMHGVAMKWMEEQSRSLNIPFKPLFLKSDHTHQSYEELMKNGLAQLRQEQINGMVYGDIFLQDLKEYREKLHQSSGITPLFPLWESDTLQQAQAFIRAGFKAWIIAVNNEVLDASFCGRAFDEQFLADLPEGVDLCGENGEFHSFVWDGPCFQYPIPCKPQQQVVRFYPNPKGNELPEVSFTFVELGAIASEEDNQYFPTPEDYKKDIHYKNEDMMSSNHHSSGNSPQSSIDNNLKQQIEEHWAGLAKPPGSLGELENWGKKIAAIQKTTSPVLRNPHLMVFAGDHGIAKEQVVNPYPQAITAKMVYNFLKGGAAINTLSAFNGLQLSVVNAGVVGLTSPLPDGKFMDKPVRYLHYPIGEGTADYRKFIAIQHQEWKDMMQYGNKIADSLLAEGCNLLALGEMGIGNSSSAALLMHAITGLPMNICVGAGTAPGIPQESEFLQNKLRILEEVAERHQLYALGEEARNNPDQAHSIWTEVFQRVGGFETGMMIGVLRALAGKPVAIVVDGFIATSAWALAAQLAPALSEQSFFAHCSAENGHKKLLEHLQQKPMFHFQMRLGEGTGAAIAAGLLQQSTALMNNMAHLRDL